MMPHSHHSLLCSALPAPLSSLAPQELYQMPLRLLLGSCSAIKRQAVQEGFRAHQHQHQHLHQHEQGGDQDQGEDQNQEEEEVQVCCFEAQSGVPSQPVGVAQTQLGAFNRATHALALHRQHQSQIQDKDEEVFHFAIGIESGMWKKPAEEKGDSADDSGDESGSWVDCACVCAVPVPAAGMEHGLKQSDAVFMFSEELCIPPLSERPFAKGPDGEWSVLKVLRKAH
jgi:hypothetical protein